MVGIGCCLSGNANRFQLLSVIYRLCKQLVCIRHLFSVQALIFFEILVSKKIKILLCGSPCPLVTAGNGW
jgi:hypothetical protein